MNGAQPHPHWMTLLNIYTDSKKPDSKDPNGLCIQSSERELSACLVYMAANVDSETTKRSRGGLPCSPVVKISPSNAGGVGLIPGGGTKIHMPQGQKT